MFVAGHVRRIFRTGTIPSCRRRSAGVFFVSDIKALAGKHTYADYDVSCSIPDTSMESVNWNRSDDSGKRDLLTAGHGTDNVAPPVTSSARQTGFCTAKLLMIFAVCAVVGVVAASWHSGGIVYDLMRLDSDPAVKLERLKMYFLSFGNFAPLVYVVFVTVEVVVAPIPGLMLYAPGGIIFGPFPGGALSLLGNVIGAAIACTVTRILGRTWLCRFFEEQRLEQLQAKVESHGMWLVFLLRINPLTSSDMISYAAGLTRIPIWKVTVATGIGMAPLCFAQAWLADGLLTSMPALIYPLIVACVLYLVFVVVVVKKMLAVPA